MHKPSAFAGTSTKSLPLSSLGLGAAVNIVLVTNSPTKIPLSFNIFMISLVQNFIILRPQASPKVQDSAGQSTLAHQPSIP